MTSVDVHGATINAPIFAETASAYSIVRTGWRRDHNRRRRPPEGGWRPLQFARVSFGALGVVASVTLDIIPRPYANSLGGERASTQLGEPIGFLSRGWLRLWRTRPVSRLSSIRMPAMRNPLGWPGLPGLFPDLLLECGDPARLPGNPAQPGNCLPERGARQLWRPAAGAGQGTSRRTGGAHGPGIRAGWSYSCRDDLRNTAIDKH